MLRPKQILLYGILCCLSYVNLKGQNIDSLILIASNTKGEKKAEVLYKISGELVDTYPDIALVYLKEAESIIGEDRNASLLPSVLLTIGDIYYALNESERSLMYFQQAYDLFQSRNNLEQAGYSGLKIGNVFYKLGDFTRAFEYYIESIEAYKKTGNIFRIAHLNNNLGIIAQETGDLTGAEAYYRESLRLYDQSGESDKIAKVLNNIGMLFYDRQELDSSMVYLLKVLNEADESSVYGKYLISSASNNIALIYFDLGELENGLRFLYDALSKARAIDNLYNVTSAFTNLGSFHTVLGNYDSADYYLDKGFQLSDSLGYMTLKHDLMHEKSVMYAAMKDYKSAYEWVSRADTLGNRLFDDNMSQRIVDLRVGYEQELKKSEIERLRNEKSNQIKLAYAYLVSAVVTIILIVIIAVNLRVKRSANLQLSDKNIQLSETLQLYKESEEQLRKLNKSKDRIFSIIAHDLRNPVAAVSGFTELLYDNFDQLNKETQKEYLLQIMQGTQRMQNLLENMLIWARTQMKVVKCEPENIKVTRLIDNGIKQVAANLQHKKISYKIETDPEIEIFADYQMIITVIRNLLMNAIKFSFPGGNIEIHAKREDQQAVISIKDEGIGIQQEIQEKIFSSDNYSSTPGTSGESGSGLGLKISRDFMERNNGEIGVNSIAGRGAVFYIKLPCPS